MRNRKPVKPLLVLGVLALLVGVVLLIVEGRPMLFGAMAAWGVGAVLLLFSLSFATKKRVTGRTIRRSIYAVLLVGVLAFAGLEGVVLAFAKDSPAPEEPDAVVILGAAVWDDVPSPVLKTRLNTAVDWLQAHPDTPVVVTGGVDTGEIRSEAAVMAEALEKAGISPDRIYLEPDATNTLENLTYSVAVLEEAGLSTDTLLVVSSAPHLARVQLLSDRLSLSTGMLAAPVPGGASYRAYLYLREAAALVKSFLFDHP